MKRLAKPAPRVMLALRCEPELFERLSAIAERDAVTRSHALRQLIEFALPHFEAEVQTSAPQEALQHDRT